MSTNRRGVLCAACALALAGFLGGCGTPAAPTESGELAAAPPAAQAEPKPAIHWVKPAEAVAMIAVSRSKQNLVVLDIREIDEYEEGHVVGVTLLLPGLEDDQLARAVDGLDRKTPCLLYCVAGARANRMATRLEKLGFHDLAVLEGGYRNLEAGGAPVEVPPMVVPEAD